MTHFIWHVVALLLLCICLALVKANKVVRMKQHENFVRRKLAPRPSTQHEVVIAVQQRNLGSLERELLSRSSPDSPTYLKWMTFAQVNTMTSNPAGAKAIVNFLLKSNINITSILPHHNYIRASASVSTWESLLQAKFYIFDDRSHKNQSAKSYVRAHRYSMPKDIALHASHIFNTVELPQRVSNQKHVVRNRKVMKQRRGTTTAPQEVSISFLNSLYSITSNQGSSNLSQSVFETSNAYFSPDDLTLFQENFGLPVQAAEIIGGYTTASCSLVPGSGYDCFEANLDTQYIMGIAQVTNTTVWHISDTTQDPFLSWILAVSADSNPPSVNSISWGSDEQTVSTSVMDSFDIEAQKLGLMGVTIIVSSGDNGVAGYGCRSGCNSELPSSSTNCVCGLSSSSSSSVWTGSNTWTGTGYIPKFPATSPYVTVVGGTAGPEIGGAEVISQSDRNNVITSGGGFSGYHSQPSWQTSAVADYFSRLQSSPPQGYNNKGRGYPDVSLIAVNYPVYVQGVVHYLYGTSASAPVFAGMISLINANRNRNGLGNVGYINPTLYSPNNTNKFNDVTSGENNCCSAVGIAPICCNSGFHAAVGWDPTSGFGSITYNNLTSMF